MDGDQEAGKEEPGRLDAGPAAAFVVVLNWRKQKYVVVAKLDANGKL